MVFTDSSEEEPKKEKSVDDYFDDIPSSLRVPSKGQDKSRFGKLDLPLVLMGALVLVLIVFLAVAALSRKKPDLEPSKVDEALEARLARIETQLAGMEDVSHQLQLMELQEKNISNLTDRVMRLEEETSQRMAMMERKLSERRVAPPKVERRAPAPAPAKRKVAAPAAVAKPAASKRPATAPKKAESRYYEVKAGETLYSIARKNNLSVDEVKRLNPSMNGSDIFPGQKLKVSK